jgi:hypothetical protein
MPELRDQRIVCPKCFVRYPAEARLLVCQNEACVKAGQSIPESEADFHGDQPVCRECGREISMRLCPKCGFEFSGHSAGAEMLGVSMVGAERCGKSHFLTVLVNSVKQEMTKAYGCALYPLGGDTPIAQDNEKYFEPLFVHGQCVSSTLQEDVEPLIYSLVFPDGKASGKTANLTFYDACGANFGSVRRMEESNRNIYNSRGVLFLIDPSQFSAIRERRRALGKPVSDVDPATLLARMIHLIRGGGGQSDIRKKITIPIAVCLTKLDIVKPYLDASSFLASRSRQLKQPGFDPIDFDSCSMEVMSLIESWSGKDLINQIMSQFETYGFFGFSSLGEEPSDDNRVTHIQPHRVMDPFLWILWKNSIIGTAK